MSAGSLSLSQRLRQYSSEAIKVLQARNFVDELFSKSVFSEDERDDVRHLEGRRSEQARKFMDIMQTKNEKHIQTFFEVLRTTSEDRQPELYKIFFPEATSGSTGQTGKTTATVNQVLDTEVTTEQLNEVARVVSDVWRPIGTYLGFERAALAGYEENKPSDRLYNILSDWKRKVDHPTVRVLSEACEKAGVGGEVRKILGIPGK